MQLDRVASLIRELRTVRTGDIVLAPVAGRMAYQRRVCRASSPPNYTAAAAVTISP